MKNAIKFCLLYAVIWFTLLRCCAFKSEPVQVDNYAMKYVNEFVEDLIEHGIDYKIIKDKIDDVVFYPLASDYYGLYVPSKRQIVLNGFYYRDSTLMRKIVYHELGHLYGLSHDIRGLMATGQTVREVHNLYDPKYGGTQKQWDIHKAYHFHRIRLHLEKSK